VGENFCRADKNCVSTMSKKPKAQTMLRQGTLRYAGNSWYLDSSKTLYILTSRMSAKTHTYTKVLDICQARSTTQLSCEGESGLDAVCLKNLKEGCWLQPCNMLHEKSAFGRGWYFNKKTETAKKLSCKFVSFGLLLCVSL
jgi:hypothetical protein